MSKPLPATDTRGPRERVYDEEIDPLVSELIDKCKEFGIPIVVGLELDNYEDGSGQMVCVSFFTDNTYEASSNTVVDAAEMILPGVTK